MSVIFRFAVPLCLAAAACVPPAPPAGPVPVAPPVAPPAPRPQPTRAADWRDWPQTPGTWRYRSDGPTRSVASFGPDRATEIVRLICDRPRRQIALQVAGAAGGTALTVRTSSATRTLPLAAGPIPAATLAAADPLLDAMAFSRGRFTVEPAGPAPLVLPAWAEVGRVVEDCRG